MSQKGWTCPKCGTIWAPWVPKCDCATLGRPSPIRNDCNCPRDTSGQKRHRPDCWRLGYYHRTPNTSSKL